MKLKPPCSNKSFILWHIVMRENGSTNRDYLSGLTPCDSQFFILRTLYETGQPSWIIDGARLVGCENEKR